jgi:putative nucleotidyltransferase with HDIG domain
MIRLCRFQAKYDWDIPMAVLRAVKRKADKINIVSSERIMGELKKIMELGKLKQAIKLMSATGLLKHVLPEIEALKGIKQSPKYHNEGSAYRHTLKVLENAPPGVENQIAALLHDVGKTTTTQMIKDEIHAYGHEEVGADIAEAIMKRLKFENDATDRVKKMIRNHMRPHHLAEGSGPKAIRKFIRDVGDELVDSILNLARADELGKIPSTSNIPDLIEKIKKVRETSKEKITEEAILDGKEIMDLLGIPTGPEVGRAKKILLELEDDYAEKGEKLTKEKARQELLEKFQKRA